jgi:undecaprenyl-phosphate galactose phosphotransferase
MSVVDRIPRSFSFETRSAHPAFSASSETRANHARAKPSSRHQVCNAWCAGSMIVADTIAIGAALGLGLLVTHVVPAAIAQPIDGLAPGVRDPLLWIVCLYGALISYFAARSHYDHRGDLWSEAREVALGALAAMVVTGWVAYMVNEPLSRLLLMSAAALLPVFVLPLRHAARKILDKTGLWRVPVVVVGTGAWGGLAAEALQTARCLGYDVVAQAGPDSLLSSNTDNPWTQLLAQHGARMVVLAFDADHRPQPGLVASLVRERVPFAVMPAAEGLPVTGYRETRLATQEAVLQSFRNNLDKPVARLSKIVFDLVAASLALVILAPVLVMIAASVSLDGGPVLFGHNRIGAKGRVFKCYKFRSMVVNSDQVLQQLLSDDPAAAEEWARTHKLRHDPRVTWIGRILRKTSLDELPQLLNVIRLEMSLVGPRPIVSLEIPKYAEDIAYYYETRPGITGLWQVSGRSDTTYAQRVRLDSWYVKNWTIGQDLGILLKTIPAVVTGRGAG